MFNFLKNLIKSEPTPIRPNGRILHNSKIIKGISKSHRDKTVNTGNIQTVVVPKNLNVSKAQSELLAYRSNISNMFTDNDMTLTTGGYLREFTDTGYWGDVEKSLTIYDQDDLVGGLVDTYTNHANTDINFDLPSDSESEGEIWEYIKHKINITSKGVLPGVNILNGQLMQSMITTGMAIPDVQWGKVKIGRKTYTLPTKVALIPILNSKLRSSTSEFGQEEVLVGISDEYYNFLNDKSNASSDVPYTIEFSEFDKKGRKGMVRKNAYPIKYKYNSNRPTLYPNPMLKRSFESISLRHKFIDADISTLELVINKIMQIKVGDKDNLPQPTKETDEGDIILGDVELAQELFNQMDDVVEVIATPYYYEIQIIMPDTNVLLDQDKYVQSTFNIYSNFGIILDPSSKSNTGQFEKINLKAYEKNAITLQSHVAGWYTWLVNETIKRNGKKIKSTPKVSFDRPEIRDAEILKQLKELYLIGGMGVTSLLEKYGLDPEKEKERKLVQMKEEEKFEGLYEPRPQFVQQTVDTNNTKTTASQTDGGGETNKNKNGVKTSGS